LLPATGGGAGAGRTGRLDAYRNVLRTCCRRFDKNLSLNMTQLFFFQCQAGLQRFNLSQNRGQRRRLNGASFEQFERPITKLQSLAIDLPPQSTDLALNGGDALKLFGFEPGAINPFGKLAAQFIKKTHCLPPDASCIIAGSLIVTNEVPCPISLNDA
jgi:hypothetical protein